MKIFEKKNLYIYLLAFSLPAILYLECYPALHTARYVTHKLYYFTCYSYINHFIYVLCVLSRGLVWNEVQTKPRDKTGLSAKRKARKDHVKWYLFFQNIFKDLRIIRRILPKFPLITQYSYLNSFKTQTDGEKNSSKYFLRNFCSFRYLTYISITLFLESKQYD